MIWKEIVGQELYVFFNGRLISVRLELKQSQCGSLWSAVLCFDGDIQHTGLGHTEEKALLMLDEKVGNCGECHAYSNP